jgi:pimeloyl-ACP methyl ester carboxylesterase
VPTVEGQFVKLETGVRLHYRDWGGDGPPIVLLHGLSSSSRIWDWTAPLLTDRHRVVALDQRSHGLSDQPDDGYGFEEVTADLDSFLKRVGVERPVLIGHSWGANVALSYAVSREGGTNRVVLVDGGVVSIGSHSTWEQAEVRMRPPEIDGTPVGRFLEFMRRWPNLKDMWTDELGEMVLANFSIRDGKIYRPLSIPNHMKIAKAIFDLDPGDLLARLDVPLLVISCHQEGNSDEARVWQQLRNEGLEAVRRVKPDATVVVMEDTIHDVPIQRPKELAEQIRNFLHS